MTSRRLLYLGCLLGSVGFYLCYQRWLSWIVLLTMLFLPWVGLVLSLPAMLQFRAQLEAPAAVNRGEKAFAALWGRSYLPAPMFVGKLTVYNLNTGEKRRHHPLKSLDTTHCGGWEIGARKIRVCDYLCLFTLPVRKVPRSTFIVRPDPLPMTEIPVVTRGVPRAWRPKFGGGYAENHELRLYRPGDGLNQIHWKLSAKTGDLIIREPMVPELGLALLTLDLQGTPDQIDRKFGRLLWLSRNLLEQGIDHQIRCLTADGPVSRTVTCEDELLAAVDALLCCPMVKEGSLAGCATEASWQYHIGGDADEN